MICEENMLLARVMPFEDREMHVFECTACQISQSRIVKFD